MDPLTSSDDLDYRGQSLPGAVFDGQDLSWARFDRADLAGASFVGARLDAATFTGADLTGATFTGAHMDAVDLQGALLEGADLTDVVAIYSDLRRADLTGADLTGADLTGANLTGADATRAVLANARMIGAKARGTDLSQADLTRADLTDADLAGAEMSTARFDGAIGAAVAVFHARASAHWATGRCWRGSRTTGASRSTRRTSSRWWSARSTRGCRCPRHAVRCRRRRSRGRERCRPIQCQSRRCRRVRSPGWVASRDASAAASAASTTDRSPASTSIAMRACPVRAPLSSRSRAAPSASRRRVDVARAISRDVCTSRPWAAVDGARPVAGTGAGDDVDDAVQRQVRRGGEVGLGRVPP